MHAVLSGFAALVADIAALTAAPFAPRRPPREALRFRMHGHIARMPGRARRRRVRGDH